MNTELDMVQATVQLTALDRACPKPAWDLLLLPSGLTWGFDNEKSTFLAVKLSFRVHSRNDGN